MHGGIGPASGHDDLDNGGMMFEIVSRYWAAPLSNALMVLVAILILRPIIKKVAVEQLAAAIHAMNEAKNLPNHIAGLVKASEELRGVNRELISLNGKVDQVQDITGQLERLSDQLVVVNRRVEELQKLTEERPPEGPVEAGGEVEEAPVDVDSWEAAADIWFDTKEHVEDIIARIPDGRVRRPFDRIPRYRYDEITERLLGWGFIDQAKADAINAMDEAFRSIRNRKRPVTPEMVEQFKAWRATAVSQA